jgi:hypothetical protein
VGAMPESRHGFRKQVFFGYGRYTSWALASANALGITPSSRIEDLLTNCNIITTTMLTLNSS